MLIDNEIDRYWDRYEEVIVRAMKIIIFIYDILYINLCSINDKCTLYISITSKYIK